MKKTFVAGTDSNEYSQILNLYSASFPIFEQRTEEQQREAFSDSHYRLLSYTSGDEFIGFISYWEFAEYIYIEHFAVNSELRGKGYGSKILTDFLQFSGKQIVLEIDPVVDEKTAARLCFYQRCGFVENFFPHLHPAYRKNFPPHSLTVLSSRKELTDEEYATFRRDLETEVMKKSRIT